MADELISALLQKSNLRALVVVATDVGRRARELARLSRTSAALLAQGLAASALLGALQKSGGRLNLQVECDGPLRGMFLDADNQGNVRGYAKNRQVDVEGAEGAYRWRPALGNSGFISVLRDRGQGEYYRSSVQLKHFDLARDLEEYFTVSEQLKSHVVIEALPRDGEPLGTVAAVLVQPLPDGDRAAFESLGPRLHGPSGLSHVLRAQPEIGAAGLLKALFPDDAPEVMSRFPLGYSCTCSKERVLNALASMGKADLEDLLAREGKAEVTCEFCSTHYVVAGEEIRALLAQPPH